MQRSWRITAEDRDTQGNIRLAPVDRSLADLLPPGEGDAVAASPRAPITWTWQYVAAAIGTGLLLALAFVALINRAAPVGVIAPTIAPATGTTTPQQAPASVPRLPHAVVAYVAPDSGVIGAIEPGRVYTATAVYGGEWVQIDVERSGSVWVRAGDVPGIGRGMLPDLAPVPTVTSVAPVVVPAQVVPAQPVVCDPATAPYRVTRVYVYGSVTGVSCTSEAEAQANADSLAADLAAVATATAGARTTPEPSDERGRQ